MQWLHRPRAAERRYPTSKVREELPHVQGKRNPSKMVGAERAPEGRQTETTITDN